MRERAIEREREQDRGDVGRDIERFRPNRFNRVHDQIVIPQVELEIAQLRKDGASVTGVRFEAQIRGEMTSIANRSVFGPGNQRLTLADRERLGHVLHLPVVDGKVRIPDARIIYIDREGRERNLDLEIITRSYRRGGVATKASAGFHIRGGIHASNSTHAKGPLKEDG